MQQDEADFDRVIAVDWSARSAPSPARPTKDAIWVCQVTSRGIDHPVQYRTRDLAMAALTATLDAAVARGERVLLGFDFAYGYPEGVARRLTGSDSALAVWDWLAERIEDTPDNRSNRLQVAAEMSRHFPGLGPFWGAPGGRDRPDLPARAFSRRDWGGGPEHRASEIAPRAKLAFPDHVCRRRRLADAGGPAPARRPAPPLRQRPRRLAARDRLDPPRGAARPRRDLSWTVAGR